MYRLQQYVIGELLKSLVVSVLGIGLVITLVGGLLEAIRHGLPVSLVGQMLPFLIVKMSEMVIPAALLFATCATFSGMSNANELLAIRALGIRPLALAWPVLVIAVLLSCLVFWMYDLSASWGRANLRRIVTNSLVDVAYMALRTQGAYTTHRFSIVTRRVDGQTLVMPTITLREPTSAVTITARSAELISRGDQLTIRCFDGEVDVPGRAKFSFPDAFEQTVRLNLAPSADDMGPADLPLSVLPEQIAKSEDKLRMLARETQAVGTAQEVAHRKFLVDFHERRLRRLHVEPSRRLSNGFSCFSFALVGIPVAIWWKHAQITSVFMVCFVPILVGYYPLLTLGEHLALNSQTTVHIVWIGNLLFSGLGVALLRYVERH